MGFDVSGVNPKVNTVKPKILKLDCYELDKKTKKKYFATQEKYRDENPGIYFRNNVWWWRPLWAYVCSVCYDVMTEDNLTAGDFNDGKIIPEETVQRMVEKLIVEIALENHIKYEKKHTKDLKELPLKVCKYCKGTGVRKWEDEEQNCNVCNTEHTKAKGIPAGKEQDWACSYPFSARNVEQFTEFLEQSGGIQIY